MIAEPGSRRKGIAKEALQLMMSHGHSQLVCSFIVQQPGVMNPGACCEAAARRHKLILSSALPSQQLLGVLRPCILACHDLVIAKSYRGHHT